MSDAPASNQRQIGPRQSTGTRFAKARVAKHLTLRDVAALGFSINTVMAADRGQLPKHPAIRAALLAAVGLGKVSRA